MVGAIDPRVRAIVAQVPACGAEPAPPDPDGLLFAAIRETLLSSDVRGTPQTTTGPLPVVSFSQRSIPSLLTPLTAFRTLHSRVLDYTPGMWEDVAYRQRKFFEWGGWLATRPMDELHYWRVVMRRERDGSLRIRTMARDHAEAIVEMRAILRERGAVGNRDFETATRTRTQSYRGRKDSALALYYLWRTGEVMTHHRENFERVYALTEAVAPAHLIRESHGAETDRFLIKKDVGYYTLPVLWGDRLVARFDSRLDRTTNTFVIPGLWLEDRALGKDEAFAEALACGFARFVTFLGASKLDTKAVREPLLRRRVRSSHGA